MAQARSFLKRVMLRVAFYRQSYVPTVQVGQTLFVSGHIAKRDGASWTGKLGADCSLEDAKQAARSVAIDLLATIQSSIGDLDKVKRIAKLLVLVNSTPDFTQQHLVANGASEFFVQVFGDAGKHARSAFGVAQLPFGSCVEIELIAELR